MQLMPSAVTATQIAIFQPLHDVTEIRVDRDSETIAQERVEMVNLESRTGSENNRSLQTS